MLHAPIDTSLVAWALGVVLVIANAIVCVAVARAGGLTRGQIIVQTVVVWLIPVIGAGMVGTFLWSEAHPRRRLDQTSNLGEAPGIDGHFLDAGGHAP
jgi:hypothetical protein